MSIKQEWRGLPLDEIPLAIRTDKRYQDEDWWLEVATASTEDVKEQRIRLLFADPKCTHLWTFNSKKHQWECKGEYNGWPTR